MILQHKQTSLPTREIPVFNGDPLNYKTFVEVFQHGIEKKNDCCRDRLYYLEQYIAGPSRELVRSCFHMDADNGFAEALLIANAYMGKAFNWSSIKAEMGKHCMDMHFF